jgi:hypothetical protein
MAETSLTTLERVVIGGDLARLSSEDRMFYYQKVCESLQLNPLTRPFQYLHLSGKLVLYAAKEATDQLRARDGVSITKIETSRLEDIYVVVAYARNKDGREDCSTGAVALGHLKGDALANAVMKAETKAKRRVTLSICGLGMLDESEIASIAGARKAKVDLDTGEILEPAPATQDRDAMLARLKELADARTLSGVERRRLWQQYCGDASQDDVDLSALADLLAAVEAL